MPYGERLLKFYGRHDSTMLCWHPDMVSVCCLKLSEANSTVSERRHHNSTALGCSHTGNGSRPGMRLTLVFSCLSAPQAIRAHSCELLILAVPLLTLFKPRQWLASQDRSLCHG